LLAEGGAKRGAKFWVALPLATEGRIVDAATVGSVDAPLLGGCQPYGRQR